MQKKQPLRAISWFTLDDRTFIALSVLVVLLGSFVFFSGSAFAASTSVTTSNIALTGYCNNPSPHCYATRDWLGHTGGSNVLINPYGSLTCYGCSGFIDEETWFSDYSSSQCSSLPDGSCWVEGGISTWPANDPNSCHQGTDSVCAFWADNRPSGGGYHEHPLYNFGGDGVNLYPYLFYIDFVNANGNSSSGSNWYVQTNIYKNGTWIAGPSGESTHNSMNVNDITIGSELSDSRGTAGTFYYQNNQWMDGSGTFHYQTNSGVNYSTNPPPNGYWQTAPCNCSGNTGGSFGSYD